MNVENSAIARKTAGSVETTDGAPPGARRFVGPLVFIGTLIVYYLTAYRTVPFWDAGEFITTGYILGIPHQPSTPLYVLLGRLASLVPLASVPFRVNLMSALAAATAAFFTYAAVVRLARRMTPREPLVQEIAGVCAALLCAFSSTIWFNAIEAEVYAVSSAVMAFCIWAVVRWRDRPGDDDRILLLVFYLLSLSIGIHLGTYLVLPGLAVLVALSSPRSVMSRDALIIWALAVFAYFLIAKYGGLSDVARWLVLLAVFGGAYAVTRRSLNTPFLVWSVALFVLGVSVHLFLLIRAGLDPVINEADPSTWSALMDTLQRKQYPLSDIFVRRAPLGFQFDHMFFRYLREQWVLFPGVLGLGGLLPLLALVGGGYAQARRDRHGFAMMLTHLLITGPFLVIYLNFTDHEVRERDYFFAACFQMAAMWIGLGAGALTSWARRRGLARVVAAAMVILALQPLVTGWHAHDRRHDTIARDYAYNMLTPLPPDAILFTNGDNDTFPLWYVQFVEGYRTDVRIVNLSLLNTTWYIRQLRDGNQAAGMAPVPIHLKDEEIDMLRPRLDENGGVLFTKDLAVRQILQDNAWRDPVYLAVTVPDRMGLEPQLTMECLSHRIHPQATAERINVEACRECLYETFTPLAGILNADGTTDTTFIKTENERRLVQNYAAIHFYLAVEYDRRGKTEAALDEALRAEAIVPGFTGNRHFLGLLLEALGREAEAEAHYRRALTADADDFRTLHALGDLLLRRGELGEALPLLERAVELTRGEHLQPYLSLFDAYAQSGQVERAVAVLDVWLRFNPADERIRAERDRLVRELRTFDGDGDSP
jgi:hypothetical protein